MVEVCSEITQVTTECSCYCAIMTIFQQASCVCFIWVSFAFFNIYLSNSTLLSTTTSVNVSSVMMYVIWFKSRLIQLEHHIYQCGQWIINTHHNDTCHFQCGPHWHLDSWEAIFSVIASTSSVQWISWPVPESWACGVCCWDYWFHTTIAARSQGKNWIYGKISQSSYGRVTAIQECSNTYICKGKFLPYSLPSVWPEDNLGV